MWNRISASKSAWFGIGLIVAALAAMNNQQFELYILSLGFPSPGVMIMTGLTIVFGRDAVEKVIRGQPTGKPKPPAA